MVPGAILGALFNDVIEQFFGSPRTVAVLLLVTGLLLVASEWLGRRVRGLHEMTWRDALALGVAQAVAIAPGLSRSGATIAAGLLRDLRRDVAARFSFLMSIPIIAGAAVMQTWSSVQGGIAPGETLHWAIGLVASMVSGYLAIRFLLRYLRLHSLRPFAYYCWTVGILTLVLTFVR